MGTNLDILAIEDFILYKKDQPKNMYENYENKYEKD